MSTDKKVMRVLMNGGLMDGKDLFCVNWLPEETREYQGQLYKQRAFNKMEKPTADYIGDSSVQDSPSE